MSTIFFNSYRFRQMVTDLFANRKSLVLDGVNQEVTMGTILGSDPLALSSGDFTVSVWAKPNGNHTSAARLIDKSTGNYINGYGILTSTTNQFVYFFTNSSLLLGTIPLDLRNSYNNFTMTYDSTSGTLEGYINGTLLASGARPQPTSVDAELVIGNASTLSREYNGLIDQPTIWNKKLSLDEIRELIQLRDISQHSAYANNIFWLEFEDDDISGTTVTAKNGGVNGTLVNGATNNLCIPYPYPYQLEANNYTPLQNNDGGFAFDFDGVNDYIDIGDVGINSGDTFTLSLWAKMSGRLCSLGTTSYLSIDSGVLKFFNGTTTFGTLTVPEGQTSLIQISHDGTNLTLRVNGLKETTVLSLGEDITNFQIGRSASNYGTGIMTDIIFLNVAVSDIQNTSFYNNHSPRNEMNESLSGNLVGYWRAKESTIGAGNVPDLSGNGNNGTMTNMTENDVMYAFPRAAFDLENDNQGSVIFNGTDEYINIPDSNDFSFGNGTVDSPFSICCWAKPENLTNFEIFSKDNTSQSEYRFSTTADGRIQIFLYSNSSLTNTLRLIASDSNLTIGKWHLVTMTYDGSQNVNGLNLYINARLITSTSANLGTYVAMTNTTANASIGTLPRLGFYADGQLSQCSLIHKELSLCEIQEMYNDGSPTDLSQVSFASDIISWWRLDQTDDLTTSGGVVDQIGSNNGTAQNMTSGNLDVNNYPTN